MVRYMDCRTRWHRCALALSALFTIALPGCQSAVQSSPASTHLSTSDRMPADPSELGSRRYRDCIAAARDNAHGRERCLDEELAYQQRSLEGLYQERAVTLDAAHRDTLHAEHRTWRQETDQLCGTAIEPAVHLVDQGCQLARTITRFNELNHHPSSVAPAFWAQDMPDADGALELRLGDAVIAMQSDGCAAQGARRVCRNPRIRISTPTLRGQTLSLPEIWLPETDRPDQSSSTGYRGSLRGGFVDGWYGIMLSDINMDGHEDLMVWSGRDGSYGDPSYTYYFYDEETRRLIENKALAELLDGYSLSRIVDGRLFAWRRSGPCERSTKTVVMHDRLPRVADSRNYNTCEEGAP